MLKGGRQGYWLMRQDDQALGLSGIFVETERTMISICVDRHLWIIIQPVSCPRFLLYGMRLRNNTSANTFRMGTSRVRLVKSLVNSSKNSYRNGSPPKHYIINSNGLHRYKISSQFGRCRVRS